MQPKASILSSHVRQRADVVRHYRARRYRTLLLRAPGHSRLRKRYLDARTDELVRVDLRQANLRLILTGTLVGIAILVLVGILGGIGAAPLLERTHRGAGGTGAVLALGISAAAAGSIVFALLALRGCVVFADLIGEIEAPAAASGRGSLAALQGMLIEVWGGGLWGTVCGVLIGVAAGTGCAVFGFVPGSRGSLVLTGATAAGVLGVLTGATQLAAALLRGPNIVAHQWARLGPLPYLAYLLPLDRARQRYLGR